MYLQFAFLLFLFIKTIERCRSVDYLYDLKYNYSESYTIVMYHRLLFVYHNKCLVF
jgi:hypothetical protein